MKTALITTGLLLTCTFAEAQFTGTSPAILNGRAEIKNVNGQIRLFDTNDAVSTDYTQIERNGYAFHIYHNNSLAWQHVLTAKTDGKVGINTATPTATLHVADVNGTGLDTRLTGFTLVDGSQASMLFGGTTGAPYGEWGIEYNELSGGLNFWKPAGATTGPGAGPFSGNYHLFIANDGDVSIGTNDSKGYKFAVYGSMIAEAVTVKLYGTWPDYVFGKKYDLMSLSDVEEYINANNHLPGVPSAGEVEEEGINVGEMNKVLLEKIEELTLYLIEQNKQNEILEEKLKSLEEKYNELTQTQKK